MLTAFAGFGAAVSPLVCQAILAQGVPYYKFYWGTMVGSALNVALLSISFRPTTTEFARERRDAERQHSGTFSPTSTKHEDDMTLKVPDNKPPSSKLASL